MEENLYPPKSIDLSRREENLIVTWQNGEVIEIPTEELRRFCACASCRAKKIVGINLITTVHNIKQISVVGSTGIQIVFADGHDRGIFPWHYLRAIARGDAEAQLYE